MKTGTQTANSFNCQIRRVINSQKFGNFINNLSAPPFFLHYIFRKCFCNRDTCINVNTKLFKLLGCFNASTQKNSKQYNTSRNDCAQYNTDQNNKYFLGFDWLGLGHRIINNTHITNGAGFCYA